MEPVTHHVHAPDVSFDGGDLDCGNGLLLLIRKHIDPLARGQLLEIMSTEISVDEDLPAWCRMTNNELVSWTKDGKQRSFLVCKGKLAERQEARASTTAATREAVEARVGGYGAKPIVIPDRLAVPAPAPAPAIAPLSAMSIGSWPRPRWMVQAVHERMEGRLDEMS